MKIFILVFLLLSAMLHASSINVALAANVSYAIDDLKEEFKKTHPNVNVRVTLSGSGNLTAQIKNGAPYDIFMSANMKYPQALYKDGLALGEPKIYAQGSLAVLSKKKRDFSNLFELLKDREIQHIAVANPKTAPYGKATIESLKNAKVYKQIKNKFVYAQSISQTVTYTLSAADIGFIAKSSLYSKNMAHFKEGINWITLDSKLYTPINQGIVLLKHSKNSKDAKAFYEFILGKDAREIFKKFGYTLP